VVPRHGSGLVNALYDPMSGVCLSSLETDVVYPALSGNRIAKGVSMGDGEERSDNRKAGAATS